MRLDCHQHFWKLDNSFTNWPTADLNKIYRDFCAADLSPLLEICGVDGTILVQAAPNLDETEYLLQIASETPFVKGVVGWIDFSDPVAPQQIAQLSENRMLKGLRPMLQDISTVGWVLQDELQGAFEAMIDRGLSFDALVKAGQIEDILQLSRRYPDLPIILDHAGKPEIANDGFDVWAARIAQLAVSPAVHCKISGLWTEAGGDHRQVRLQPYVDHLIDSFGANRLIWGSDWPVVELAGTYDAWLRQSELLLSHLDSSEREAIFGSNGAKFYGIVNE